MNEVLMGRLTTHGILVLAWLSTWRGRVRETGLYGGGQICVIREPLRIGLMVELKSTFHDDWGPGSD